MKVSIITVCYNSEETIKATIESIINQNYNSIEHIIVDGKSTDRTLKIVKQYEDKISKIISESDCGLYDAINKGISIATGDIVGLLHSDDILATTNTISKIVEVFKASNCEAIYGDLQYVDRNDSNKIFRNWIADSYKHGMFLKGWMPPHPTLYLRRELFNKLGNYNTDFKFAADYELMLRYIHKHQIELSYIPETLVKMRTGGKSNSSFVNRIKANLEDRKAWRVNDIKANFLTPYMKPLSKLKQFYKK
ncbi:MAG: glycosyltransferase [Flavobacteriales bacterium]|nr:glycosyltransferase [Flavobacteriales bacterium]